MARRRSEGLVAYVYDFVSTVTNWASLIEAKSFLLLLQTDSDARYVLPVNT